MSGTFNSGGEEIVGKVDLELVRRTTVKVLATACKWYYAFGLIDSIASRALFLVSGRVVSEAYFSGTMVL